MREKFGCPLMPFLISLLALLLFVFGMIRGVVCKIGKRNMRKEKYFVHFYQDIVLTFHSTGPFFYFPLHRFVFQKRITSAVHMLSNMNDVILITYDPSS